MRDSNRKRARKGLRVDVHRLRHRTISLKGKPSLTPVGPGESSTSRILHARAAGEKGLCRKWTLSCRMPCRTTASSVYPETNSTRGLGVQGGQLLGDLPAAHARHDHVGDQQVDRPGVLPPRPAGPRPRRPLPAPCSRQPCRMCRVRSRTPSSSSTSRTVSVPRGGACEPERDLPARAGCSARGQVDLERGADARPRCRPRRARRPA